MYLWIILRRTIDLNLEWTTGGRGTDVPKWDAAQLQGSSIYHQAYIPDHTNGEINSQMSDGTVYYAMLNVSN